MSAALEAFRRIEAMEPDKQLAFNARCLELARQNGYPCLVRRDELLAGSWWYVPRELQPIVGCMAVRVA